MSRVWIIILVMILVSCRQDQQIEAIDPIVIHTEQTHFSIDGSYDTLWISPESRLYWRGTKMRGLRGHEGEILFKQGYILQNSFGWQGGVFAIDMETIQVTDIPKTDPIPIKNLTDHLKNPDFFDVDKFPISRFYPRKIQSDGENLKVEGELEIKGISKSIHFDAKKNGTEVLAAFSINRFDWNIAYTGSWADRTLVDREIHFQVKLVLID
jgi:hypothetical protein